MESITPKERFLPCPVCSEPISSNLPKCECCGLEVSPDGIDELVRTEEATVAAIQDALVLKAIAQLLSLYSALACLAFNNGGYGAMFLLEIWVFGCLLFVWKLIRWHQNHSQIYFELDILKEATKEKNQAIIFFIIALAAGILFLWRNL